VVKKKVLWLAHEANVSGANIALLEYVDALKDEYEFHFILPHNGNMEIAFKERRMGFSVIHQYGWAISFLNPIVKNKLKIFVRSCMAIFKTCLLVVKLKPHFIFTNTQIPFAACVAARLMKKPHVWWLHEFGEEDFGFTIGFGKRERGLRWMQKSKLIIANSKAILNKFKTLLPTANIKCIYQPISVNEFSNSGIKLAPYLMFGQLIASKGHLEVLQALNKSNHNSNEMWLHIIGPCEDKEYLALLNDYIDKNRLVKKVKIETGFFIKENIMPKYEYLIVGSKAEAFGRVIVEANKMGLKVIAKNNGGATELMNETNGLLFNSVDDLVAIFNKEIVMPNAKIRFTYNEKDEIKKLKESLDFINE
jgi:glycosyltransferase involved in cell wall biosynthesis